MQNAMKWVCGVLGAAVLCGWAVAATNDVTYRQLDSGGVPRERVLSLTSNGVLDIDASGRLRGNQTIADFRNKLQVYSTADTDTRISDAVADASTDLSIDINAVQGSLNAAMANPTSSGNFSASAWRAALSNGTLSNMTLTGGTIGNATTVLGGNASAVTGLGISNISGLQSSLDAKTSTTTTSALDARVTAVESAAGSGLSGADLLGTVTTNNAALADATTSSGKGYFLAVSGALTGTNSGQVTGGTPASGGAIVSNGTNWVVKPPATVVGDATISRVKLSPTVEGNNLNGEYLSPLLTAFTPTVGKSLLPYGTNIGSASAILGQATVAGTLASLNVYIGTTGTLDVFLVRSTGTANQFTEVSGSRVTVTALATGNQTWTTELGTMRVEAGDYVAIFFATAQGKYNGGSATWYIGGSGAGTATWSATNSDYSANVTIAAKQVVVPDSVLSSAAQTAISASPATVATASALSPLVGNATVQGGQVPLAASGASLAGGSGTLPLAATKTGTLTEINLMVNTTGIFQVVVLTPASAAPTLTVKSVSANVTAGSAGSQTFTAANFGTINVAAGDFIGIYCPSSGGITLARAANNSRPSYFLSGALGAVGSTATWTTVNNHDYHGNYKITYATPVVQTSQLEPTLASQIAANATNATAASTIALARKMIYSIGFDGGAAPSGWTVGESWTTPSGGLLTPIGAGDFSQQSRLTAECAFAAEFRTLRIRFVPQGTGIVIAGGYRYNAAGGDTKGTIVGVDDVNRLLKLYAPVNTAGTEPSVVTSATIPPLVSGRKYEIVLTRNQRINSASLIDLTTGDTLAVVTDGTNTGTINYTTGSCNGSPVLINKTGRTLFTSLTVTVGPAKQTRAMLLGDSITEGNSNTLANTWSQQVKSLLNGDAVISGVESARADALAARLPYEIQTIKPEWVILFYGTNDQDGGLATLQSNYNAVISWCQSNGINVAVGIVPPVSGRTFTNTNAWLLALPESVRKIRFDLALTLNRDGSTIVYGLHPDAAGNALMAAQVLIDVPELVQ